MMKRECFVVKCEPMASDPEYNQLVLRCEDPVIFSAALPKSIDVRLGDVITVELTFNSAAQRARA